MLRHRSRFESLQTVGTWALLAFELLCLSAPSRADCPQINFESGISSTAAERRSAVIRSDTGMPARCRPAPTRCGYGRTTAR